VPVATESTEEYRQLRELLDTGSAGGAATVDEAERKQARMVFGGAAAVVLLVIIGLVAFPKGDGKGSGSKTAGETKGATTGKEATNGTAGATATTAAPIATPAGLNSFQYEVPSANILPGLKPGDSVDFYNGPDPVAQHILVQALGEENEVLPGFRMRSLTIAATPDDMRKLNSVTAKTKRSMATGSAPTTASSAPATPPASG
jgi:hypothetical protein